MNIVLCTGGFDPLHSGHIKYLNHAAHLGDHVVIGLNSDAWLERKKGRAFMPWRERAIVLDNLHMTGEVIAFDDSDGTACDAIRIVKEMFPFNHIIFANGGDRTATNIPEMKFDDVEFVFGVGGEDKANSSSWILEEWTFPKISRQWGYWKVLNDKPNYKVKELVLEPGKSLSVQRHFKRSEHWYILSGECEIKTILNNIPQTIKLSDNSTYIIGKEVWHTATNTGTNPCHILEVQYGELCIEEDIERKQP